MPREVPPIVVTVTAPTGASSIAVVYATGIIATTNGIFVGTMTIRGRR
jgi:hypothetical protein